VGKHLWKRQMERYY